MARPYILFLPLPIGKLVRLDLDRPLEDQLNEEEVREAKVQLDMIEKSMALGRRGG